MKNFKTILVLAAIVIQLCSMQIFSQSAKKKFKVEKEIWTTPEKDQNATSLCAIFSDMSFLESELHRLGRGDFELSTMYVAYHLYTEKALRYIRLRGKAAFDFNGYFNYDGFEMIKKYGVVPLSSYSGLLLDQKEHLHHGFLKEVNFLLYMVKEDGKKGKLKNQWKNGKLFSPWLENMKKILNKNMGEPPNVTKYKNKSMTPLSFSETILKIPFNDYKKITSYTYIGFDRQGELLTDGNWLHKKDFYNIRLDEYIALIDYALYHGFSLTGDFHITVKQYKQDLGYSDFQLDNGKKVTQDIRDNLYENWQTNDVHNVHIIGIAKDENGKKYYKIKDSAPKKDFPNSPIYFSENYFRARVLSVMLHKNGIPEKTKKKLEIN